MEAKMAQKKVYDKELKVQAVKLGREIGFSKAGGVRFHASKLPVHFS